MSVTFGGTVSDRWETRFGMREFTIRDKKFYLNGKPLYLKATFFEGLYPVKLAYPDSREMAIREIQLAKDAGFNMIRPWRKPPPPMWLDLADEMGVLTVGSLAVECMDLPIESASLSGWVENEVRESILRDRNRTCVVQWELFNEITERQPNLKRLLHPMSVLARQLDPTRLILDESGGWAQGANMYLPYESEPTKFNDIHDYPGPQINEEVYSKLLLTGSKTHEEMRAMGLRGRLPGKNVVPGLMSFFSELGYGSLPDLVDNNRRFADDRQSHRAAHGLPSPPRRRTPARIEGKRVRQNLSRSQEVLSRPAADPRRRKPAHDRSRALQSQGGRLLHSRPDRWRLDHRRGTARPVAQSEDLRLRRHESRQPAAHPFDPRSSAQCVCRARNEDRNHRCERDWMPSAGT